MPSGPEALAGLRRVSFFRTLNSVTVGGLVCCTSPDASGCSGEKEFIGARNALFMVLERALRLESGPWVKTFQDWSRGSTRSGLHPNEPFNFIPPPTGGATSQMFNFGLVVFRATGRKLASLLQANPVWRSWVREFKLFVDPWWFMRNDRLGFRAKQGTHAGLDYCFERARFLFAWLFETYQETKIYFLEICSHGHTICSPQISWFKQDLILRKVLRTWTPETSRNWLNHSWRIFYKSMENSSFQAHHSIKLVSSFYNFIFLLQEVIMSSMFICDSIMATTSR